MLTEKHYYQMPINPETCIVKQKLAIYPFYLVKILPDIDQRWLSIKVAILDVLDSVAPLKQVSIKDNSSSNSWYDNELVHLARKRNAVYKRARVKQSLELWA